MNEEAAFIMTPQRWDTLHAISQGHDAATSIAAQLHISTPYAANQLKLLEAAGYLKKEKKKHAKIGKPRTHYTINKELIIIAAIKQDKTQLLSFKPAKNMSFIFNTLFSNNEEELYFLQKFYYTSEDLIFSTDMMALIDNTNDSMHFLVITPDVEKFRKHYSSITLSHPEGKEKKIVFWSHTLEEVQTGLRNKEDYYVKKIRQAAPFWDDQAHLDNLKQLLEETP
ncbi:MarR family transcriptional regulator [Candidatus Woesearchaeota archaeon]|nr:MarR family transcriptional regulator [Candidatus Woesearchaeota archaeon]